MLCCYFATYFLELTCHSDPIFITFNLRSSVDEISELLLIFLCRINNVVYSFRFRAHCSFSVYFQTKFCCCWEHEAHHLLCCGGFFFLQQTCLTLGVRNKIYKSFVELVSIWSSALQRRQEAGTYLYENVTDC